MEVMEEHTATCRCCITDCSVGQEVFSLFDDFYEGLTLSDIIFDLFGFQCKQDGYPDLICSGCVEAIVNFYNFKGAFLNNQECLRFSFEEKNENAVKVTQDSINQNEQEVNSQEWLRLSFDEKYENVDEQENINEKEQVLNEAKQLVKVKDEPSKESHVNKQIQYHSNIPKQAVQTENGWSCKFCQFEINDLNSISIHIDSHKRYICEQCGTRFFKKAYLDEHSDRHSKENLYVCPICKKAFKRRTVLVKHKRIHTHPRHYKCEHCGMRFNSSSTLSTHVYLKHIGERKFVCNVCHQRFPLRATLQKHVYRHQARTKTFSCQLCKMCYMDKSSLNRHMAYKHTE